MNTEIQVYFVAIGRDPTSGDRKALIFGTAIKASKEIRLMRVVPVDEEQLEKLHAILSDDADLHTVDPATLRKQFAGSRLTAGEGDAPAAAAGGTQLNRTGVLERIRCSSVVALDHLEVSPC